MSQKSPTEFNCKKCDYTTRNKYDWKKHLSTTKHKNDNKMVTNGNINGNMVLKFTCEKCCKGYKHRSGLSRHKKKGCANKENKMLKSYRKKSPKIATRDESEIFPGKKFTETLKVLAQTMAKQGDLIEKLVNTQKEMVPKLGNNNNNKISINVFLNEYCKNAMNFTDFVENIKVSIEDLEYTNAHGYVMGISKIFTRNLTDMDVTERPIHCSDRKRLQFYVKEEDKWKKDKDHTKLDKSIKSITKKQILHIKEWEKQHPNFLDNDALTDEWNKLILNMMGGDSNKSSERNRENIKKNICGNICVKEAIMNN